MSYDEYEELNSIHSEPDVSEGEALVSKSKTMVPAFIYLDLFSDTLKIGGLELPLNVLAPSKLPLNVLAPSKLPSKTLASSCLPLNELAIGSRCEERDRIVEEYISMIRRVVNHCRRDELKFNLDDNSRMTIVEYVIYMINSGRSTFEDYREIAERMNIDHLLIPVYRDRHRCFKLRGHSKYYYLSSKTSECIYDEEKWREMLDTLIPLQYRGDDYGLTDKAIIDHLNSYPRRRLNNCDHEETIEILRKYGASELTIVYAEMDRLRRDNERLEASILEITTTRNLKSSSISREELDGSMKSPPRSSDQRRDLKRAIAICVRIGATAERHDDLESVDIYSRRVVNKIKHLLFDDRDRLRARAIPISIEEYIWTINDKIEPCGARIELTKYRYISSGDDHRYLEPASHRNHWRFERYVSDEWLSMLIDHEKYDIPSDTFSDDD